LLADTYGIIVYQEQVMQIAQVLAGYSPGQADVLRKAMGKKIPEILQQQKETFMKGCAEKKVEKKIAEKVFDLVVQFGGYGFNKSHASAYGLVSYQTAFLKANFPVEFMAAVLTSEIGHSALGSKEVESKLVTYMGEVSRHGDRDSSPRRAKIRGRFFYGKPSRRKEESRDSVRACGGQKRGGRGGGVYFGGPAAGPVPFLVGFLRPGGHPAGQPQGVGVAD
jgi:DNA polymerase III alpha subunit